MGLTSPAVLRPLVVDSISGSFFVPSYQRGYRWGPLEVAQLLDDLQASRRSVEQGSTKRSETYYLQPIAVRRREDDSFELIDGQQRLTTLYLIKSYILSSVAPNEAHKYSLAYETRPGSAAYLAAPSAEGANENIDFLHIFQAKSVIEAWFRAQDNPTLAASKMHEYLAQNVCVIWYEIPEHEDGIELFRRLNVGKIPLTSAELIKASLLTTVREHGLPVDAMSRGWDSIERDLHDPQFWAFASGGDADPPTRISLLLDAMGDILGDPPIPDGHPSAVHFSTFERSQPHIAREPASYWNKVLDIHSALRSWFEDRDLFHLIGYLTATGTSIRELLRLKDGATAPVFRERLVDSIRTYLNVSSDGLADLTYDWHRTKCEDLLLLFNVELIRTSSDTYARYPFAAHAAQKWSVEHINAQNAAPLATSDEWCVWLDSHINELERRRAGTPEQRKGLRMEFQNETRKSRGFTKERYREIRAQIIELLGEEADDVHTIDNLALLTQSTNSAIGNDVFSLKRQALITMEKRGHFIPPATRGVFQKYFSRSANPHLHLWDATDRADYLAEMRDTLGDYLQEKTQ